MDLEALASLYAPIIIAQFKDVCDIINPLVSNVDGTIIETLPVTYSNIACAYEPSYRAKFVELAESDLMSVSQRFKIIMVLTSATETIIGSSRILIHARGNKPQLIFSQLQRLEESLSPLLVLEGYLMNQ